MSVILAIAAKDFNLYLHLTTALILERTLTQLIPKLLEKYNYPAAIAEL